MTTKITSANITQSGTSGISSVAWQAVQTTGFTAVAGRAYPCDTTSAAFTVTLPASPVAGNVITLTDYAGTWGTNNLTINPNGLNINGSTANGKVATSRGSVNLVYVDSTQGWISYGSNLSTAITQSIVATGGNEVKTVGSYKYHIFTTNGTFSVSAGTGLNFEVMSCGGGGAGGYNFGGGGGGGELDLFTTVSASVNSYTVTVGAAGVINTSSGSVAGGNGGTSSFALGGTTYVSSLGGGGGGASGAAGVTGGSGGGSGAANVGAGGASGSNTNGGGGGAQNSTNYAGGGGGGAGTSATGGSATTSACGNGGAGYTLTSIDSNLTAANFTSLTGMTVICSGGGGGGGRVPSGAYPTRGIGGTGAGSGGLNNDTTVINTASAPTAFGCGGGGGMWYLPSGSDPTGGYAGVVIVRYLA
jgi:hypothetical protein